MKVNVLFERAKDGYYSCFKSYRILDWPATEIQRKRLRLIF